MDQANPESTSELSSETIPPATSTAADSAEAPPANAPSTLKSVFAACLPVLKAREDNLLLALQLLEGSKDNFAITMHLRSLEMDDDEDQYEDPESGEEEEGEYGDGLMAGKMLSGPPPGLGWNKETEFGEEGDGVRAGKGAPIPA
jgi:hypothetical protein